MFFMGGMGGGDVKLMAAIAAFARIGRLAELLLATALAGGVFAVVMAVARGALGSTLRPGLRLAVAAHQNGRLSKQQRRGRLYCPTASHRRRRAADVL